MNALVHLQGAQAANGLIEDVVAALLVEQMLHREFFACVGRLNLLNQLLSVFLGFHLVLVLELHKEDEQVLVHLFIGTFP